MKATTEGKKILELRLDKIRIDGGTQSRAAIDPEWVQECAEAIDDLPEAVVFHDGSDYWLGGGFHRFHAHRKKNRKVMRCEVRVGTVRDAILFSVRENATHGLPRTPDDKRHVCRMLLTDKEWSKWSDRQIAAHGKVGRWLVADVRKQLKEEEKTRRDKEKADKAAAEAKAKADEEAKATAERAKTRDGWVCPGTGTQPNAEGNDSLAGAASENGANSRTYRTKHGTVSQMNTGGVTESNKGRDRNTIRKEEDPDKRDDLEKQLVRSIPKAIKQAKKLGLTLEEFVEKCRAIWESIPVAH